jgi:hypothetical protein
MAKACQASLAFKNFPRDAQSLWDFSTPNNPGKPQARPFVIPDFDFRRPTLASEKYVALRGCRSPGAALREIPATYYLTAYNRGPPNLTVTSLEQVWVPASHTLYV